MKKVLVWADVAFFLGFAALIVYLFRQEWGVRCWIGLVVAVIGFLLWISARLQLGGSFSVKAQARRLVTTGLYTRLRHPIYLFGFLAYTGIFVIWGRWIPFFCFLAVYGIEIVRVRKEERVLEDTFGEEYLSYKARTWF